MPMLPLLLRAQNRSLVLRSLLRRTLTPLLTLLPLLVWSRRLGKNRVQLPPSDSWLRLRATTSVPTPFGRRRLAHGSAPPPASPLPACWASAYCATGTVGTSADPAATCKPFRISLRVRRRLLDLLMALPVSGTVSFAVIRISCHVCRLLTSEPVPAAHRRVS